MAGDYAILIVVIDIFTLFVTVLQFHIIGV